MALKEAPAHNWLEIVLISLAKNYWNFYFYTKIYCRDCMPNWEVEGLITVLRTIFSWTTSSPIAKGNWKITGGSGCRWPNKQNSMSNYQHNRSRSRELENYWRVWLSTALRTNKILIRNYQFNRSIKGNWGTTRKPSYQWPYIQNSHERLSTQSLKGIGGPLMKSSESSPAHSSDTHQEFECNLAKMHCSTTDFSLRQLS